MQRAEAVQRVADELEQEGGRDHRECGRAWPRSKHHARRKREEKDIEHRERESDDDVERARVGQEARLHDERPRDDGDADRDDAGVDQACPVAAGRLLANHQQQSRREDDIRPQCEEVARGREWNRLRLLEAHRVKRIRRDRAEPADGHEEPGRPRTRAVQPDADEGCRDGRDREELVPAVVDRALPRQRHIRERARGRDQKERPIRARNRHPVPIGTGWRLAYPEIS